MGDIDHDLTAAEAAGGNHQLGRLDHLRVDHALDHQSLRIGDDALQADATADDEGAQVDRLRYQGRGGGVGVDGSVGWLVAGRAKDRHAQPGLCLRVQPRCGCGAAIRGSVEDAERHGALPFLGIR